MQPFIKIVFTKYVFAPLKKRSQCHEPVGNGFTQFIGVFIPLQIAGGYGQ